MQNQNTPKVEISTLEKLRALEAEQRYIYISIA